MDRFSRIVWGVVAVLVAAIVAWVAVGRWKDYEIALERRALDARAGELTARALAPGSPLACLDAVANATVEIACEKSLFASPETVAAAIAYVDAKLSLLAAGIAHAARDPGYEASLYRLRRSLEADRFGMVAQALASRGCIDRVCPALKLFRDPRHIAANLRQHTFDANVVLHAAAWRPESAALAAAPPPAPHAPSPNPATGVPVASKYDFPSAASIPPVSIMNAEPPLSKTEETAIAPPAPNAHPAKKPPPARRQHPASNAPAPVAPGTGQR
jgi:hypothetical protein